MSENQTSETGDTTSTNDDDQTNVTGVPTPTEDDGAAGQPSSEADVSPLDNPLILQSLFKYFPVNDLRNIRLVSKKWYDLSIDNWRNLATVLVYISPYHVEDTIFKGDLIDDDLDQFGNSGGAFWKPGFCIEEASVELDPAKSSFPTFFQLEKKPYRKFKLVNWVHHLIPAICDDKSYFNFWRVCGSQIKSLNLSKCVLPLDIFTDIVFKKVRNLEELVMSKVTIGDAVVQKSVQYRPLKKLSVLEICVDEFTGGIDCKISWQKFMGSMPNLNSFKLCYEKGKTFSYYGTPPILIPSILNEFYVLIKNGVLRSIQKFDVYDAIPLFSYRMTSFIEDPLLSPFDFRFRSFQEISIDVGWSTEAPLIQQILSIHAPTLKMLKLFRAPFAGPIPYFPFGIQMKKMRELHLIGNIASSFTFLKCMNNLEILTVNCALPYNKMSMGNVDAHIIRPDESNVVFLYPHEMVGRSARELTGFQMKKLRSFEMNIDFDRGPHAGRCVQTLMKMMPNLTYLNIPLDSVMFQIVCRELRHLRKLVIEQRNDINDEIFTGISLTHGDAYDSEEFDKYRPPNITDLEYLSSFTLFVAPIQIIKLGDHSVRYGFLALDYLKEVNLFGYNPMLSRESRAKLKEKVKIVRIALFPPEGTGLSSKYL